MKEYQQILEGRCWIFGDHVSTDDMLPGFAFSRMQEPDVTPKELGAHCMGANRPGWSALVSPGDIILAGKNFGCGSSRPAAVVLQGLGIQGVVAQSVSRIFFRNSINLGFPVLSGFPSLKERFEEGDTVQVNLALGEIKNLRTGEILGGVPVASGSPPDEILKAGGLTEYLYKHYGECFSKPNPNKS